MPINKFLDIQSNAKSLLDRVSFSVVRTNPKLTTNVKLVTNGEGIWLDSYSATKELSEDRYKAYWVSGNGFYNRDLANFYKGLDFVVPYTVHQSFDDLTIKTGYDQQYETMYWCGAEHISSLEFDEELGIVAPIWLDDKIPERFVVFRVDEPSYVNIREYFETTGASRGGGSLPELDFKKDILDKCRIVKSFDLTENSKFGAYIRRYYAQEDFPRTPLKVSLENGKETVYSGISIEKGCFIDAHEYNYSKYFVDDIPIQSFDEYLTLGFERNRLACANLLNIEFLFDDETAGEYTINRYFGMYCNLVEDGEMSLDFQGFTRLTENTYGILGTSITKFVPEGTYIGNIKGVVLPTQPNGGTQRFPYKADVVDRIDSVFWVKDVKGELHSITRAAETSPNLQTTDIRLTDTDTDINLFTGFVTNGEHIDAELVDGGACSQIEMRFVGEIPPASFINIYDASDTSAPPVLLACVESDFAPDPTDPTNPVLEAGWSDGNMFCGCGTGSQIAHAVAKAVNSCGIESVEAFSYGDTVLVKARNAGEHCNGYYIEYAAAFPDAQGSVEFGSDYRNGRDHFYGGSGYKYLKVRDDDSYHFNVGNYLKTNNTKGYGMILYKYIDKSGAVVNGDNVITGFGDGPVRYNIILDTDDVTVGDNSQVAVYEEYLPTYGRLGFYPIRDFDFSTKGRPTLYGDIGELNDEYFTSERALQDDEGEEQPQVETFTFVVEDSTVRVDIQVPSSDGIAVCGAGGVTVHYLGNGEYEVTVDLSVSGGVTFGASTHIDTGEFNFETISTTLNGKKEYIDNEYDRLFENCNKELMLLSKTSPYIGKWVCVENGLDVREKPYRINTSLAFGQNSFSPNPYSFDPKPDEYNQEWPYIFDEIPFSDSVVRNCWSYIGGSIHDLPQSNASDPTASLEDLLRSRTKDWFEILFVQDYAYRSNGSGSWSFFDHLDYRRKYSILEHGSVNTNSDTFFRGVKVEVLQKTDYAEVLDNNLNNIKTVFGDELNGYRFSVVIVPYTMDYTESVDGKRTKVIRNDVFRFIVVLVYSAKEIKDAKARLVGNNTVPYVKFDRYTRYLLYESEKVAKKLYENGSPTVWTYGEGKILSVQTTGTSYEGSQLLSVIGENTNFLTEMTVNDNGSINKLVLLKGYSPDSPNTPVQMTQFKVVELQSDSVLTAVIDTQSAIPFSPLPPNFVYVTDLGTVCDGNISNGTYMLADKNTTALVDQANNCVYGNLFYNINHFQRNVVYEQVTENGFHSSENGEYTYALRLIPPELNAKYNYMKLYSDGEYVYYGAVADNAMQISRQGWYYMPLFRDVVYFKDPMLRELTGTNPIYSVYLPLLENARYCNTVFAHGYHGFGVIRDLDFHRVNDVNNNVFDLSDDERPLYPTSNKFSIGHRDVGVFNSSFDPYYYTETDSATLETDIHGTASMAENKAFLGSKCMNVPEGFTLDTFTYETVGENPKPTSDILLREYKGKAEFRVNVIQRVVEYFTPILRPLFEDYIDEQYSYGDKTTVEDDIDEYIRRNILQLYRVDKVDLYVRWEKSGDYTPVCDYTGLAEDNGWKSEAKMAPASNVSVVSVGEEMLDKEVAYNIVNGRKYWFGMSVSVVRK